MTRPVIPLVGSAIVLAACAGRPGSAVGAPEPTPGVVAQVPAGMDPFAPTGTLTRTDGQGAIMVQITPVNLDAGVEQLEFAVALNTHSVDLSMDLAPLATLTTDAGAEVGARLWDAPLGGHHVGGKLIFPAAMDGGAPVLDGARKLTVTIRGLDVPLRIFEWDLR